MKLLDKYMLTEWGKSFLIAFMTTLGILLLENIYDFLPDLLSYGISFTGVLEYYALTLPSFLRLIIPISLLISLLFMLGSLHHNNEITAMRSVGLSIFKITRSFWFLGLAFTAFLFFLNAYLIPWSVERSHEFLDQLRFAKEAQTSETQDIAVVYNLAFDNPSKGHLWVINRFSEYTYQGFGVNVYIRNDLGNETMRIMAREAYFDDLQQQWHFIQGRELLFENDASEPTRSVHFDKKTYPELTESPQTMLAMLKLPRNLSLFAIRDLLEKVPLEHNSKIATYATHYYSILASPFICMVAIGIAIPLTLTSTRTNPLVSVSKAALLFFAYYLLVNIFQLLGAQQVLSPLVAAWAPNIFMLALALTYFRKFF